MSLLAKDSVAPQFELADSDGIRFSLQDALAHGPVLLAFFKVACPTCQFTLPFLERIDNQFRGHGVQVWALSQDNAGDTRQFAEHFGITFPILIDETPYTTSRAYRLEYVPSLFLIGSDGRIVVSGDGFSKSDLLTIHRFLTQRSKDPVPMALFSPQDHVPEYKPG